MVWQYQELQKGARNPVRIGEQIRTIGIVLKNSILGGNLVSLALIRKPKLMVRYVAECMSNYRTMYKKSVIPRRNVFDVLPSSDTLEVKLGSLNSGGTWFRVPPSYIADIVNLCLICQIIKPKTIFEIGTMTGYSALHFAMNTPDETEIYTLDLPKDKEAPSELKITMMDDLHIKSYAELQGYHFDGSDVAPKINCLFGDSAIFDFSSFYNKIDFFFIDGAHSYEYVRSDTLNALKCCHPGSVIAWHDFGRVGVNGVSKWLFELSKEGHSIYFAPGGSLAFMLVQ